MRNDAVYKRVFNALLDILAAREPGWELPSENNLKVSLGASRTTIRKALAEMEDRSVINKGLPRHLLITPQADTGRFPQGETVPQSAWVETRFMQWMLKDDTRPGSTINELELARKFGISTTGIREFLNRFQRFGLIERRPRGGWMLKGFTQEFALELFEIREMFELRSAMAFAVHPRNPALIERLIQIRDKHLILLSNIDNDFRDFSEIDSQLHRLVIAATPNRFVDSFYDIMTLIFHYHYQWRKHDERQRNEVAIYEHLAYIDALVKGDVTAIEATCRTHLQSARLTMTRSIASQPA